MSESAVKFGERWRWTGLVPTCCRGGGRLPGLEVAWCCEEREEGAEEEARELEHGEEGDSPGAGVVDEDAFGDVWPRFSCG